MVGSLAEQNTTCLEVNSLMFESHEERPHGMVLVDNNGSLAVVQGWMRHDCIDDRLVNPLAIFVDFCDSRPNHVVLMHVIPEHLVDTNLKDTLEIGIDWLGKNTSDAKLVDVKTRSMSIVEYLGMSEAMDRWTIEVFFSVETSELYVRLVCDRDSSLVRRKTFANA